MRKSLFILIFLSLSALLAGQTPRLVIPVGHTGEIGASAFSMDGKYVVTGSSDGTAKLWNIQGKEITTFKGHSAEVNAMAFSPDGQFFLTGSDDGTARLWALSGESICTFRGHGASVNSVAFSPDGQFILTGSDDGAAKLWDTNGKAIQTYPDHPSRVLAVAFSTDGKYVLTGSGKEPTKSDQMTSFGTAGLFDRESGLEIRTFSGHSAMVTALAFSADGKHVLTGSLDGTVKLFDPESGSEIRTFNSKAGFRGILAVSISPDGKYVLAGSQYTAKCWELSSGNLIRSFETRPDDSPGSMAFSPPNQSDPTGGKYILIGGEGYAELRDWAGRTFRTYSGHSTAVTALDFFWPAGEKSLLMGCADGSTKRWNLAETAIQSLTKHDEAVIVAAFSADGSSVLTAAADNTVKQWDKHGREIHSFGGDVDYPPALALSPPSSGVPAGGKYIIYGTRENTVEVWSRQPRKKLRTISRPVDPGRMFEARVDWEQLVGALAFSPADGGKLILIGDATGNIEIRDRDTGGVIKSLKGISEADIGKDYFQSDAWQTITFDEYVEAELKKLEGHTGYIHLAVFSPDGKFFLTGAADKTAKLWDIQGKLLHAFSHAAPIVAAAFSPDGEYILTGSTDNITRLWNRVSGELAHTFEGHTASALAFSPDGKFVVTGSRDNTSKFWDVRDGKELATLIAISSTDWVITSPSGLFDASPGAMKLMHYIVGLEVIDLEQLKDRYYEPGLLSKLLGLNQDPLRSVDVFNTLPLYPEMTAQLSDDKLKLQVTLEPRSGGIGKLSLFVNGKEVTEDANPQRVSAVSIDLTEFAQYYLPNEPNKLALRVYNEAGWLKSSALELEYQPPATARGGGTSGTTSFSLNKKPSLHAVVVGTANYAGDKLDLKFADLDAAYFSRALRAAAPNVFGERVFVTLLSTDAEEKSRQDVSSKATVKKTFADIAAKAQAQDVLVIYFSGHGVNYGTAESGQFYYLTKDIASENLTDPEIRNNYAISSSELTEWIKAIPALKQVMIIDACNSGKIVEDLAAGSKDLNSSQVRALDRMKDRTGMFILTGSAADKVSYEAGQYGQGLLTYSLLQGMSGLALTEDKRVDVMTLFQHSRDKVPDLAKGIGGIQTPVLAFPLNGASFDIGIVDASVKIPVAQVKPVFIRNVFQDEDTFDDGLGLTQALADYFRRLTVKGAQAELIYVDVSEYENAYSIKGRYTVSGDEVEVRGRLFKGKTAVGEPIALKGNKNALEELVEEIVGKVSGMIK